MEVIKGRKGREGKNAILERPNAIDVDSVASNQRRRKRKERKRPMPSVSTVRAPHQGLPNMACERGRGRREEKSEIDWACMIEEEALELNAAEEEKQSQDKEFDLRGLSEFAKKQVEDRKKKLSSHSHGGVAKERETAILVKHWPRARGKGLSQNGGRQSTKATDCGLSWIPERPRQSCPEMQSQG